MREAFLFVKGRVGAVGIRARCYSTLLTATEVAKPGTTNGSLAERVADLAGIGRGEHADLSTNKTHLDDFGR